MKINDHHSLFTFVLTGILLVIGALSANAELRRFALEWSGEQYGNRAQAKGFMVLDDGSPDFSNPGNNDFPTTGAFIKDFQVTVSRATNRTHNGTFNAADFGSGILIFTTGSPIDLTKELVGQPNLFELNLGASNPLAPNGTFNFTVATGGGTGDQMALISWRPLVATSPRVYKCTLSVKGRYKYCDQDHVAAGVPQWVCKNYRNTARYYMTINPLDGRLGFFWLDSKNKVYDSIYDWTLPELKYALCRPPTASAPAGRWEACLPLWCHTEGIDMDGVANPNTIDATRCRIACLNGVESLRRFTFKDLNTDARVSLRDYAVPSFRGGFCQATCYDTLHYAFDDPKRDRELHWPFAESNPGEIRVGGGTACITGTMNCRLDTRLTAAALRLEATDSSAANTAIIDFLNAKGWSQQADERMIGQPLSLQPENFENLEPLIP